MLLTSLESQSGLSERFTLTTNVHSLGLVHSPAHRHCFWAYFLQTHSAYQWTSVSGILTTFACNADAIASRNGRFCWFCVRYCERDEDHLWCLLCRFNAHATNLMKTQHPNWFHFDSFVLRDTASIEAIVGTFFEPFIVEFVKRTKKMFFEQNSDKIPSKFRQNVKILCQKPRCLGVNRKVN